MTITVTFRTTSGSQTILADGTKTVQELVTEHLPTLPAGIYTYKVGGETIPSNAPAQSYDGKTIMIVKEIQGN